MLVLPADHLILDQAAFAAAVARRGKARARRRARRPSASRRRGPETGFGYIECGAAAVPATAVPSARARFVEKPPLATARRNTSRPGRTSGTPGCSASRARADARRARARTRPSVLASARPRWQQLASAAAARPGDARDRRDAFGAVPDISIDYAVMEKAATAGEVVVVRGAFDWSDVGLVEGGGRARRAPTRDGNRGQGERVAIAHARHLRARRGPRRRGRRRATTS